MSKKHMGSSMEEAQAIRDVVAWHLAQAMKKKKISKARMATLLQMSRTQVDSLLDPKNDITPIFHCVPDLVTNMHASGCGPGRQKRLLALFVGATSRDCPC
jgi:predicted XRE-type DNA-binding protein